MKKLIVVALLSLISHFLTAQQPNIKVGLTLSGGGAKGLAHIGILQAIDSAGLNIDYITGTSMGSIMGALYAAGYSGNQIEEIARTLDWNSLFSGSPLMSNVNIIEKEEFDNYAVEIPIEKGKLKIGTGLIEGQEIWIKFQEIFLPVYNIKDFNNLSIPFKCIATNVVTGEAVLMDKGEIVTAIRASMAIPTVFTAIEHENTKLVDGGVVRNFPVRDAIDMGANYTIGVNISTPMLSSEELTSALDVLYQISFYKDAEDFQQEVKLCNVLIEPPMTGFTSGSFSSANEIINTGKEWGLKYYPAFKHLADSLRKADPNYAFRNNRLPEIKKITVDTITVTGLKNTSQKSFLNHLNLQPGKSYDGEEIGKAVRKIYGSRTFTRINYGWIPTSPGKAILNFDVIEKPVSNFKFALHYHTFSKISMITAIETKNLFIDRSSTLIKLNISENYRGLFKHNQTFGKQDNNNAIFSFYYESFRYPIYDDFQEKYIYRNNFMQFNLKLQHSFNLKSAVGIGSAYELFEIKPIVYGNISAKSGNNYFHSKIFYDYNSLDQKQFPTRGTKIHAEAGFIHNQKPDDLFIETAQVTIEIDTLSFDAYGKIQLGIEHYSKLNEKFTIIEQLNGGININEENVFLNHFYVGGINDFVRNQITFAGLNEYEVYTNSIVSGLLGLRYNPIENVYTTLRANVALYDFAEKPLENLTLSENFLSGYSITLGYSSGFGPIAFSLIYSDQSKRLEGYINVGYHF